MASRATAEAVATPSHVRLRLLNAQLHGPACAEGTAAAAAAASAPASPLLAADIERERERIAAQNQRREKGLTAADHERLGLPFPVLCVAPDGSVPGADLLKLEAERAEAVARHAYREAALMHDLLIALGPASIDSPAPQLAACLALQTADDRAAFFLEHGFCVVQAFEGAALQRLQDAWREAAAPCHQSWREASSRDGARLVGGSRADLYYDIPNILEQGAVDGSTAGGGGAPTLPFLELVDHPPVAAVLERIVGPELRCWQALARTLPAPLEERRHDPLARSAYSTWHRDSKMAPDSWPLPVSPPPTHLRCSTSLPHSHQDSSA